MKITALTKGDHVSDATNRRGKVVGFTWNSVVVRWDHTDTNTYCYTDDDLLAHGVRVVEGGR